MALRNSSKIFLFFFLLAGLFFYHLLSGQVVQANWDRPMMGLPSHIFAAKMIKNGSFPLWNPYLLCGYNYCGSGQFHLFNPLYLSAYLFPESWLLRIFAFWAYVRFALSGIFTYLFVLRLTKARFWAVISGVMYMFSGSNIAMLTLVDMGAFHPMFLFPLLLYLALLLCEEERPLSWILLALSVAFMFLDGMLHLCVFALGITVLFFAWHSFFLGQGGFFSRLFRALKKLFLLGMAISVGILISSIRLLPFLHAVQSSARAQLTPAELSGWIKDTAVPASGILRMLMPEFFGCKLNGFFMNNNMGPHLNHIETFPHYVSIAGLALSFLGMFRRNNKTILWTLFAAGMLIFTINSPLSYYIERYLLRGKEVLMCRYSLMLPMCLAVLAGYGGVRLEESPASALKRLWFIFIPAVSLIAAAAFFLYGCRISVALFNKEVNLQLVSLIYFALFLFFILAVSLLYVFFKMPRRLSGVILFSILFLDILIIAYLDSNNSQKFMHSAPLNLQKAKIEDIGSNSVEIKTLPPYLYRVYMGGERINYQGNSVYPFSLSTIIGLHDVTGGEAFCHKRYAEFARYPDKPYFRGVYRLTPTPMHLILLGIINKTYPILPRVGLYDKYTVAATGGVLQKIFKEGFDPYNEVILEENPGIENNEGENHYPGSAKIVDYQCNSVQIETNARRQSILLLADRNEDGWQAEIDGEKTRIYFADYIWRAVTVPPGRHIVCFSYFPPLLGLGIVLSVIGTAVLTIVAGAALCRRLT
ncbi:MAG: YfhO family protein [Candidatus Omnitrophota bacterium]